MLRAVRRVIRHTIDALTRPIRVLALRTAVRFFPSVGVDGFDVVDWGDAGLALPQLVGRVEEALRLIKEHEPRRYERLTRDVKRFLITNVAGAEYIHAIHACMLSRGYLLDWSTEQVAMTIVHEGTHARLNAWGIRYDIPLRERIERACVREEIAFAGKLTNGSNLIEHAVAKLDRRWWTEEEEFERRLRQLEQLGRPRWYLRLYALVWNPR